MGIPDSLRHKILVAGSLACATERLPTGAEFWFFAPQQQAADSLASITGRVGPDTCISLDEKTACAAVSLLRCQDEGT